MRPPVFLVILALVLGACSARDGEPPPGVTSTATAGPGSETPVDAASATATPRDAPGSSEHEGGNALAHVAVLSEEIGVRVAGSPTERAAAEYIASELTSYGYETSVQEFGFSGNRFAWGGVGFAETMVDASPLNGTGTGEESGPAVYVGLGRAEDVGGLDLEGAVAIAERGETSFGAKYEVVRERGAIALVVINLDAGGFTGGLDRSADIPVVGVAGEAGDGLRMAAENGLEVTVIAENSLEMQSVNVIAMATGETCRVVVGAHHDTVPAAPGANDNASGVGNLLEVARAMASDGLDEGLCFASFGAEESGLFGSAQVAGELGARGPLPEVMINLDVTGLGDAVDLIGDDGLIDLALGVAEGLGIAAERSSLPPNTGSDHQSFAAAGVPVLFLTSGDFSTIHTPDDVIESVDEAELDRIGDVAMAVISALLAGDTG